MIRQRLQNASINIGVLAVSSIAGAREFITADPPIKGPETIWPGIWLWLLTPTKVVILVSAVFAVLSGFGTIKRLFFDPAGASEAMLVKLWKRLDRLFAAKDNEDQKRFEALQKENEARRKENEELLKSQQETQRLLREFVASRPESEQRTLAPYAAAVSELAAFRRAEAIIAALGAAKPDHPGFARDLAQVRADIAALE